VGRGGDEDGKLRGELEVKIGFTHHVAEKALDEDQHSHRNILGLPGSEGRGSMLSIADDASSTSGKKKSPSLLNVSAKVAHQFGGSLMNLGMIFRFFSFLFFPFCVCLFVFFFFVFFFLLPSVPFFDP
jgi:hypothetical protein